jgi:hypothetical protein
LRARQLTLARSTLAVGADGVDAVADDVDINISVHFGVLK